MIRLYVALFLCLALCEIGARFYTDLSGSPVDKVLGLLETNSQLGWKVRPNLDQDFFSSRVVTDKYGFRINRNSDPSIREKAPGTLFLLGPSSTFGWGVESEETYAQVTARLISRPSQNLGQIGYTVVQGERLLPNLSLSKQTSVILAFGLNELDRYRFFFPTPTSDLQFFSSEVPRPMLGVAQLLSLFHGLRYAARGTARIKQVFSCPLPETLPLRVPPADYVKTMTQMLKQIREKEANVIVVNTPYRPSSGSTLNKPKEDFYSLALNASRSHECYKVRHYLQLFHDSETDRIRFDIARMNDSLLRWSKENQVPYIDAYKLLGEQQDFVDPVHPSARGHKIIGEALATLLLSSNSNEGVKH